MAADPLLAAHTPLLTTATTNPASSVERDKRTTAGVAKRRSVASTEEETSEIPRKRRSEVDLAGLAASAGYDLLAFAASTRRSSSSCAPEVAVADTKVTCLRDAVCRYHKEAHDMRKNDGSAWSIGAAGGQRRNGDDSEDDESCGGASGVGSSYSGRSRRRTNSCSSSNSSNGSSCGDCSSSSSSSGRGGGFLRSSRISTSESDWKHPAGRRALASSSASETAAAGGSCGQASQGDRPGHVWMPIAGPMAWVQQQMRAKVNPRSILKALLPNHRVIPDGVHDVMLWKIIVNILCDQPRRQKLDYVNTIDDIVGLIRTCSNIVVLTGAGVSVSCGIPDFRSRDGVYARISVEYPDLPDPQAIFDIQYFRRNPHPFFKFAKAIFPGRFTPSRSHRFIKLLEDRGKLLRNYTQNIDTLEKVAGIRNVIECHGSFAAATCTVCGHKVLGDAIKDDIFNQVIPRCPVCPGAAPQERGIMKPDIVFFGESLPKTFHDHIAHDKDKCDLLIVVGSSLRVRPVALMPSSLPAGVPQVLINRESLPSHRFDVELLGDCDIIINELCMRLGDGWCPFEVGSGRNFGEGNGINQPMQEVRHEELYGDTGRGMGLQLTTAGASADADFLCSHGSAGCCGLGVADAAPPLLPDSPCAVDALSPSSEVPSVVDGAVALSAAAGLEDAALAAASAADEVQSVMDTSRGGSCCDDMSLDGGPSPLPLPQPLSVGPARSRAGSNATVSMQSVNGDAACYAAGADTPSLSDGFAGKIDLSSPSPLPQSCDSDSHSSSSSWSASRQSPSREHEERLLSDRAEEYNASGKTGLAALQERWLDRASGNGPLSSRLSERTYLFLPPSRYVFPGAEVYSEDESQDDEDEEDDADDDTDSENTTVNDEQSDGSVSDCPSGGEDDDRGVVDRRRHDDGGGRSSFFVPPDDEDAHDSFPESSTTTSSSSSTSSSPCSSLCPFDPVGSSSRPYT